MASARCATALRMTGCLVCTALLSPSDLHTAAYQLPSNKLALSIMAVGTEYAENNLSCLQNRSQAYVLSSALQIVGNNKRHTVKQIKYLGLMQTQQIFQSTNSNPNKLVKVKSVRYCHPAVNSMIC